jgi:hypothetical protein
MLVFAKFVRPELFLSYNSLTSPSLSLSSVTLAQQVGSVGDWPDWRGPDRNSLPRR